MLTRTRIAVATLLVAALAAAAFVLVQDKPDSPSKPLNVDPLPATAAAKPYSNPLGGRLTGPGLDAQIKDGWIYESADMTAGPELDRIRANNCVNQACLLGGSGRLGYPGEAVILGGHSMSLSVPRGEEFKNVGKLKVGNNLAVKAADGHSYVYKVKSVEKLGSEFDVPLSEKSLLVLATCAPPEAPTAEASERWVATAELVSAK